LRILSIFLIFSFLLFAQGDDSTIKEAIVKIYSSAKEPNYKKPWVSTTSRSSGSGAVIANNLILTNAHVVANATFLEVQKYNEAKRYIAKVVAVSHELDLALISTEDSNFFKGIKPLTIGTLPHSEDKIAVFGYPMGGKTISVTSGVVSRIEHQRYVHSAQKLLAIQVDAAINPGNSGGPAINSKGKIVGVVMQGISFSQNIGYLVPSTMIKHFLKDVKDGKLNGVPQLHIFISKLENPATKRYYGLSKEQTGVLVTKVMPLGNSAGVLKRGDIILAIDGKRVQDDGTIEFRENEYTSAKYAIDLHQMGDSVDLKVFRDKKVINLKEKLTKATNDAWLVKLFEYDKDPRYLIYGGYVFSPLVENMIETGSKKQCSIYSKLDVSATKDKREQVVLLGVLADRSNRGNQDKYNFLVDKINGKKIVDFNQFYKEMLSKKDGFIVLENDNEQQLIIDVKEAKARHKAILNIYNIQYDRSRDLRENNSTNSI
jgi:S1-C subfamily serine protease